MKQLVIEEKTYENPLFRGPSHFQSNFHELAVSLRKIYGKFALENF
jgi:hypothetical protein